ncbi:hypothetical protein ACNR9V_12935 [Parageobacillus thermoglucosidasius]|uniref:hypothetical protein n=1 Tax=Parageobacillus thermoglucosidasius TaxID=1426 RepID=UPI003B66F5E2
MNKKQNEMYILKSVYKTEKYKEVKQIEEPDFIITNHSNIKFGVEVTEYYYSETDARLRKIQNYFQDLINHERYGHKQDKKQLERNRGY